MKGIPPLWRSTKEPRGGEVLLRSRFLGLGLVSAGLVELGSSGGNRYRYSHPFQSWDRASITEASGWWKGQPKAFSFAFPGWARGRFPASRAGERGSRRMTLLGTILIRLESFLKREKIKRDVSNKVATC